MPDPTHEAYRVAHRASVAATEAARGWAASRAELWVNDNIGVRAAVDAVWPLAVTEGRRLVSEEIAQEIEVTNGERCPECRGKPASLKWKRGSLVRLGRCGAGHTWEHRWANSRPPERVARDAARIAEGTDDA